MKCQKNRLTSWFIKHLIAKLEVLSNEDSINF